MPRNAALACLNSGPTYWVHGRLRRLLGPRRNPGAGMPESRPAGRAMRHRGTVHSALAAAPPKEYVFTDTPRRDGDRHRRAASENPSMRCRLAGQVVVAAAVSACASSLLSPSGPPGSFPAPSLGTDGPAITQPHSRLQDQKCLDCHGNVAHLTTSMVGRNQDECWTCHQPVASPPPQKPHPDTKRLTCRSCHSSPEVGRLPIDHAFRDDTTCVLCHDIANSDPRNQPPTASPAP